MLKLSNVKHTWVILGMTLCHLDLVSYMGSFLGCKIKIKMWLLVHSMISQYHHPFSKKCVVSNCNGFKRTHERQELSSSVCQVEMVYSILWFPFSWEKMSLKWKWWKLNGKRLENFSASCIIQYIRKFINLFKVAKWILFIQADNF